MSLRHAILVSLTVKEGSGYEIAKRFHDVIGYNWNASHPQIYKELNKMAEEGWVQFERIEQQDKPAKKVYNITDDGRQALSEWVNTPLDLPTIRDAYLVKLSAAQFGDPKQFLKESQERLEVANRKLEHFKYMRSCMDYDESGELTKVEQMSRDFQNALGREFPLLNLRANILIYEAYKQLLTEVCEFLSSQ